jgi:hypothetical protein
MPLEMVRSAGGVVGVDGDAVALGAGARGAGGFDVMRRCEAYPSLAK